MRKKIILYLAFIAFIPLGLAADFELQPSQSKIKVIACCHAFFSKVEINFEEFSGSVSYDQEQNKILSVTTQIKANSLNSKNKKRDKHLRGSDFFAVNSYPAITFQSTNIEIKQQEFVIQGTLNMKGVSKNIELQGKIISSSASTLQVEVSGQINAKDFNVGTAKQKDLVKIEIQSLFKKT